MKTRTWLIALLILAIVAAYGYMGSQYLGLHRQNNNVTTGITSLKETLALSPDTSTGLDQRLAAAQTELAAAESAFAGETNETAIVNSILNLAGAAGVTGVPLSTQPWSTELISNRNFSVFHLSLQVTGDFLHLQDFTKRLESSELNTLAVTYLKVIRDSADTSANMTAYLNIAVYALAPGG